MATDDRKQAGRQDTDQTTPRDADDATDTDRHVEPNPPHTTTGKVTAPKFGSAGSGGAELEPGPERP